MRNKAYSLKKYGGWSIMRACFLFVQLCLLGGMGLWSQTSLAEDVFTELNAAYGPTTGELQQPGNWHGLAGVSESSADFILIYIGVTCSATNQIISSNKGMESTTR